MPDVQRPRLVLRAEKWVQNGYCLAHRDAGGPVFIHGALPGELVRVQVVKERSGHAFATVIEVIEPAAERLPGDCSVFPACGGCSFRHLDYSTEVRLKTDLLGEWKWLGPLRDLPGFEVVTAEPDGYRRNVRLQGDGEHFGFFGLHTNTLVPLPADGCRQASPAINAQMRAFLEGEGPPRGAIFRDEDDENAWDMPAASFSQSNRFLLRSWLETLRDWLSQPVDTLELFCGTGLIGGFARESIKGYVGVDSDKNALAAARSNFARRKLEGDFERADLYNRPAKFTAPRIIANPPRAGLGRPLIQAFADGPDAPDEILYSSCNPHTLNRDLGELERRGYGVTRARAFDFFPRTPHLELAVLIKKA